MGHQYFFQWENVLGQEQALYLQGFAANWSAHVVMGDPSRRHCSESSLFYSTGMCTPSKMLKNSAHFHYIAFSLSSTLEQLLQHTTAHHTIYSMRSCCSTHVLLLAMECTNMAHCPLAVVCAYTLYYCTHQVFWRHIWWISNYLLCLHMKQYHTSIVTVTDHSLNITNNPATS